MSEKTTKPRKDQDFRDVCDYIKKEILEYSEDMKFPKFMAMRIKGLASGTFYANKKIKPEASYDYKTILYAFKICRPKILASIRSKEFTSEQHRFNYLMCIVESEINDVVLRLKNVEKSKEKMEVMKMDNMSSEGAEYKTKTKDINIKLSDLW